MQIEVSKSPQAEVFSESWIPKTWIQRNTQVSSVLKGVQGEGGNWGTQRIPFGKIGEP